MIKIELLDESSVFAAISEDGAGRNSLLALPGAFALSGFKSAAIIPADTSVRGLTKHLANAEELIKSGILSEAELLPKSISVSEGKASFKSGGVSDFVLKW